MAKTSVVTASGVVKNTGGGVIYAIHVTKPGTGASSITIYDNTAASGTILWQGDGLNSMGYVFGEPGVASTQGIYVAVAGTTAPTVVVSYD